MTSTLYIAKNKGMVYSDTDTSYTVTQAVATQLGIPLTNSQNQKEYLYSYNVN
jgi:hypothetical protein